MAGTRIPLELSLEVQTFCMIMFSDRSERSEAKIVMWAGVNVCSATPLCVEILARVIGFVDSPILKKK